ncbi:class I SAM-dependent methyltransferase [Synechococcus elongatus]|uniref:Class I SAM-dependent methyltransferase n=1 Tax=Synechococcus elongatus PCC 11802 TaxID=2283154 RepID=A0AAT9JYW0_SYNEL|nr:class I SAM-dependent methyltransferase [Synechococcus elongatus]QFZ91283.1 class I SAM-dependent methyltransferase [Synechococcus elongatus PCC 11802]
MDPLKTAKGYDQLAKHWASDSFPKTNGIAQHQRAIAFLKERHHALDVGCGSSGRLIDFLLSYGFAVEGVDISQRMIELAKAKHPNVLFHHADICTWTLPRKYDFITAWDSIWHTPLSQQEYVITKLVQGLEPGGIFIFTTGGLDEQGEQTDSFMGPEMYYAALGIPKLLSLLDNLDCICRHLEYDQHPEQHVYVIAQKI